jgi:hypothetical protein
MVTEILIHMEGCGREKGLQPNLREALDAFLREPKGRALERHIKWRTNPCDGRQQAHDDFVGAVARKPGVLHVLLVDSEDHPGGQPAWLHLRDRAGDPMPGLTKDVADQCHLMVCCMESWLVADPDAIEAWYHDPEFHRGQLPRRPDVELIPREDVLRGLEAATRDTRKKGPYHKTRHGPALLTAIDPAKVQAAATHCKRLFDFLLAAINE